MIEPRLSCARSHSMFLVSTIALILVGSEPAKGLTLMPVACSNGAKYAFCCVSCIVPPKVAMRSSPSPFRLSGILVSSGMVWPQPSRRMNGAERPVPIRPSAVRRPTWMMFFLLMMPPVFFSELVGEKIVAELLVLVGLAGETAILQRRHQPVLDLRQRAAVDVRHGEQEAVAAHFLHDLAHLRGHRVGRAAQFDAVAAKMGEVMQEVGGHRVGRAAQFDREIEIV